MHIRFSELPRFPPHPTLQQVIRIKFADHKTKMSILAVSLSFSCCVDAEIMQRILPCIWDMFPEHQQATLKALRLLSVLSSILDTDVMREYQIEQGRRVLEDFSAYLPVSTICPFVAPPALTLLSGCFTHAQQAYELHQAPFAFTLI